MFLYKQVQLKDKWMDDGYWGSICSLINRHQTLTWELTLFLRGRCTVITISHRVVFQSHLGLRVKGWNVLIYHSMSPKLVMLISLEHYSYHKVSFLLDMNHAEWKGTEIVFAWPAWVPFLVNSWILPSCPTSCQGRPMFLHSEIILSVLFSDTQLEYLNVFLCQVMSYFCLSFSVL